MKKEKTKQEFISEYLDRKMKGHKLPYGIAYLSLVSKTENEAEMKWKKIKNKTSL